MGEAQGRIAYIDGLRAVAILSVVIYHAVSLLPRPLVQWSPARLGHHGVDLFFILSGFCLSYPTLKRLSARGEAGFMAARYAAARLVRILPPYYAAIAFFIIVAVALKALRLPTPLYLMQPTIHDVVNSVLLLDADQHYINASFWTLPIEFRWYFFFPIALWLWTKSRPAFCAVMTLLLVSRATLGESVDLGWLPTFMLGIAAADLTVKQSRWLTFTPYACVASLALAVIGTGPGMFISTPNPLWIAACFFFVLWAGSSRWLSRFLSLRPFTAIGIASYSIYLVHAPIMSVAAQIGIQPYVTVPIAIACGFAFWAIAERPFVSGRIRETLLAQCSFLERWFDDLRIPREVLLRGFERSAVMD